MAYGFNLGQIEGLDKSVQTVILTVANETQSNAYTLNLFDDGRNYGWFDGSTPETANVILTSQNGPMMARMTKFTAENVGDSYNVNLFITGLNLQFKSAVEQVMGYETIFDGVITSEATETPLFIPEECDILINGQLASPDFDGASDGIIDYYSSIDEQSLHIGVNVSGRKCELSSDSGGDLNVVIMRKPLGTTTWIKGVKSGSNAFITSPIESLRQLSKDGYPTKFSYKAGTSVNAVGDIVFAQNGTNYTFATSADNILNITGWTCDYTTQEIKGTFGGSN